MILKRTGDNFRGRSRTAVDQHDNRQTFGQIAVTGVPAFAIFRGTATGGHDFTGIQEGIGHGNRLIEQTTWVVAQIQNKAVHIFNTAQFLNGFRKPFGQIVIGLIVKGGHTQNHGGPFRPGAHGGQFDGVADDGNVKRFIHPFAHHGDDDLRTHRATHQFHRFVQGQSQQAFAIHMGDEITGFHTGGICGGAIHGGYDFDETFFLGHFNAQTAEFAACLFAHVVKISRRQEAGMRIKRRQHSVDCGFDQFGFVNFFDILAADAFKNVAKQIQLLVDIALFTGFLRQQRAGDLRSCDNPCERPGDCRQNKFLHQFVLYIARPGLQAVGSPVSVSGPRIKPGRWVGRAVALS